MHSILKTTSSIISYIWDKLVIYTPAHLVYRLRPPGVAFLVHPRDISDVYRPFPFFEKLPEEATRYLGTKLGAITLSAMDAPNDVYGKPIRAQLLSIVMDPQSMKDKHNGGSLKKNLTEMSRLAERKNLRLIALGALLPSVTQYGRTYTQLQSKNRAAPAVTTGHVCTAWCIQAILEEIATERHPSKCNFTVGILGAAGSTGRLAAQMLNRLRVHGDWSFDLHLVDRHQIRTVALRDAIGQNCTASTDIMSLQHCDYIVVVTNASEVVLHPKHIKEGAVVIDDTQPRATSNALLKKAFVVDVLAHVSGLDVGFDFGFHTTDKQMTFSCLAEMLLLAAVHHNGNFAVGPAANQSSPEILERFFEYLRRAEEAGLRIRPVTNISFASEMPPDISQQLMLTQEPPMAAE